jgi:WD repeat-containing protein 35
VGAHKIARHDRFCIAVNASAAWSGAARYLATIGTAGSDNSVFVGISAAGQVQCLVWLDRLDDLAALSASLGASHPLQSDIARHLRLAGRADDAADALVRAGRPKEALDACVVLHRWERAIAIAREHNFPQVEGLLQQEAGRLLAQNTIVDAIALWRNAGRPADAARLLARLADEAARGPAGPQRAKRLYVLAALEAERTRETAASAAGAGGGAGASSGATSVAAATMATVMAQETASATSASTTGTTSTADKAARRALDSAWHGAVGCHTWMLALRQLHAGKFEDAMRTSARLPLMEDVVPVRSGLALLALAAYLCGFYGVCSKAMIRLETAAADDTLFLTLGAGGGGGGGGGGEGPSLRRPLPLLTRADCLGPASLTRLVWATSYLGAGVFRQWRPPVQVGGGTVWNCGGVWECG